MTLYTLFTRGISYFPSLLPLLPAKPLSLVSRYPGLDRRFSRQYAMSTTSHSHEGPLSLSTLLKGDSGWMYRIEEVLTDRRKPLLCVYRARYGSFKEHSAFVASALSAERRKALTKRATLSRIWSQASSSTNWTYNNSYQLFPTCDPLSTLSLTSIYLYTHSLPETCFVWAKLLYLKRQKSTYFNAHFMGWLICMNEEFYTMGSLPHPFFSQMSFSSQYWLQTDIKANNILVDYDESIQGQTIINNVQISDLEDAVLVPPGKWLRGPLCGNAIWRSPESWCRSRQNQASDVFSFAIVVR